MRGGGMSEQVETHVRANETVVPVLPCHSPHETEEFYTALGFETTYRQHKPYLYLAFHWSGFHVHFSAAPERLDPEQEDGGGCLVMVDAIAPYHAAFTAAMRSAYGKVLAKGRPRITRLRPGATRFTLVDPTGNSLIFIQRDEPAELEYGGSKELTGLARNLDNARILAEFKNDDRAAMRTLVSGLRRHGEKASDVERARAYAMLVELAVSSEDHAKAAQWAEALRSIDLSEEERAGIAEELAQAERLSHEQEE
jgi:hypothetical protein